MCPVLQHLVNKIEIIFEICTFSLECGIEGYGETMCYYTWGTVSDESVAVVSGKNATELMWDDTLGAGLQMALFDVVGKAMEVPVYQLLGNKLRDWVPVSWWSIISGIPPILKPT